MRQYNDNQSREDENRANSQKSVYWIYVRQWTDIV
jgi:hypothetical protein